MTTGIVFYSGIQITKGATYTQTRGISPDIIEVEMIPQKTKSAIPPVGDILLRFDARQVILRDCLADKSRVWIGEEGFVGSITFQDRRWRWSRYPVYSGHWNERNAEGKIIEASRKSLQEIMSDLFAHIGEGNADVTRVTNSFFPEFNEICKRADILIQEYGIKMGYEVCLGFDDDPVEMWPRGEGEDLPGLLSSELMAAGDVADPPTPPQFSTVCFGPSVAQARFLLKAVGKDTDGRIKDLDDLSYKPLAGWTRTYDYMADIAKRFGKNSLEVILARRTVYRWYIIDTFADGSLDFPDGTGSLDDITQVLPLFEKLLEIDESFGALASNKVRHPAVRLYGAYSARRGWVGRESTDIDWLVQDPYTFDAYIGLIDFEKPAYEDLTNVEQILPGTFFLEAAFRIRDSTTRQFVSYNNTITIDPFGAGYHNYDEPAVIATTIVRYDDFHNVIEIQSNKDDVDAYALTIHATTAGRYLYKATRMAWYNRLMPEIKLDGLTSQVQHIITDGEGPGSPGHMTKVAQNMDFDTFIRTAAERAESQYVADIANRAISERVKAKKPGKGND